jgi:hypothetical protein
MKTVRQEREYMMKSIWWEKKEYKFSRNYKQRVGVH